MVKFGILGSRYRGAPTVDPPEVIERYRNGYSAMVIYKRSDKEVFNRLKTQFYLCVLSVKPNLKPKPGYGRFSCLTIPLFMAVL